MEIEHWARTYDGTHWIVSEGATLRVVDVLAERLNERLIQSKPDITVEPCSLEKDPFTVL